MIDMIDNEIYRKVQDFLLKHKKGSVTLIYPNELNQIATGGIELTLDSIKNPHKIEWLNDGLIIHQTLGYSLVTGKHLYLPYGQLMIIFNEEE